MSDYDSPWKEALDCYFELFMLFFFPLAHAEIDWSRGYEMLDKELQKIVGDAEQGRKVVDKLVKVWLKTGEEKWLLIHVEVQAARESGFPKRMYVYNYRIFDRHDREVISFAILADDDPSWRPNQYGYERWGFRTGIEFPAVKLLDYANDLGKLEANPNPFATVVLAHLKTLETRGDPNRRQVWKLRLIKGLYARGLRREDIYQLFRFIDWMMDLPVLLEVGLLEEMYRFQEERKMPYMTNAERAWLTHGLWKGIQGVLDVKFGADGTRLMEEVREIEDVELLESILGNIKKCATPDEVRRLWKS